MQKSAIVLLALVGGFLVACQMGERGIGTADSKPTPLGDLKTKIEVLPRDLVMRTHSFSWGDTLVHIQVTLREGTAATNFVSEAIKVDKRTVLRRVTVDRENIRLYNLAKGKSILEEDRDGDGHFETVLFLTSDGAEMAGYTRTIAGEVEVLSNEALEKYKKELLP